MPFILDSDHRRRKVDHDEWSNWWYGPKYNDDIFLINNRKEMILFVQESYAIRKGVITDSGLATAEEALNVYYQLEGV